MKGNKKSSNSTIMIVITASIALLIVTLAGEIIEGIGSNNTTSKTASLGLSDGELLEQADKINRHLPMMVDSVTKLLDVSGINNSFTSDYQLVNVSAKQVNTTLFNRIIKKRLLNNYCTRPELKIFREHDVSMNYNYRDMEHKFVTMITITNNECE